MNIKRSYKTIKDKIPKRAQNEQKQRAIYKEIPMSQETC